MDNHALAELLFPHITTLPQDIIKRYPPRKLPEGAAVTRIAPSPTGFMHLGNLYGAYIDERLAHQSGGVFYLRIEDTDALREVPGAVEGILKVFGDFELSFDEGVLSGGADNGEYGPYRQRQRAEIYQTFAKQLIREGKAYPCFCTEEQRDKLRQQQEAEGVLTGYYGKWAVCRCLSEDDIIKHLENGERFVLRFRSQGNPEKRICVHDLIKGTLEPPENDRDEVILKSDGIPTYHFAHVIDDHLMGTTHVVRGEEWLSTLPIHIQFFEAMGWQPPHYMHTAQLLKMDGESKRKLSKRKDPELALEYYGAQGYPSQSVLEYLMTLLNSNFEEWRIANPDSDIDDFKFTVEKLSNSGALFDLNKLDDVSKNVISKMSAEKVYGLVCAWAKVNSETLYTLLSSDKDKAIAILSIGRGGDKPRKDISKWSEVQAYLDFFYDELFVPDYTLPVNITPDEAKTILSEYADIYDAADGQEGWFDKIRELSVRLGYAAKPKDYKKNPEAYKGHVGDVSMVIRIAACGRQNSPDMYEVLKILGVAKLKERIKRMFDTIS
ncbi:MAG: glutamate--tRNA ligase [Eubacteriales bacterium]